MTMNIYLDTNMIIGWFKEVAKARKKNANIKEPEKLKFLVSQRYNLYVSTLTKLEVIRYLVSQWGISGDEAEKLWEEFIVTYNIIVLELETISIKSLKDIIKKVETRKKTLVNLMHLEIAKTYNLWLLTGDKGLLKCKFYYDKIISYIDLRRQVTQ